MVLVVIKPFYIELDEKERQEEESEKKKKHLEREEKPIVIVKKKVSEDYHGGDEVTESIEKANNSSEKRKKHHSTHKVGVSRKERDIDGNRDSAGKREQKEEGVGGSDSEDIEELKSKWKYVDWSGNGGGELGFLFNLDEKIDIGEGDVLVNPRYRLEFELFLEKFAEVKTKYFSPRGFEDYNVRKLLLRYYEGKPPSKYKESRVREQVVLILDDSGSMTKWTSTLVALATLALERGDIEIYLAPNGVILSKIDKDKVKRFVDSIKISRELKGRKIIYVGDFDGANTVIELSWKNQVVWICTEDRYRWFSSHDWVDYSEGDFKGVFIRAWSLEEMFKVLRGISDFSKPLWIDLHVNDTYREDDDYYDEDDYW